MSETAFLTIPELPELLSVPDDALVPVWSAGRLYAAPRSAVGNGGGPGSGGYATVEANAVPLTQRDTLNVAGLLQASDSGGKTLLTLPNINLASQVTGTLPVGSGGTGLATLGVAGQSYRVNALGTAIEWYTPSAGLAAPANPGDDGKVAVASGGNLSYAFVGNAHIAAGAAIALSKLANISSDRLLGRDTGGSGAIEELTVGGGLEFSGGGGLQRSALSGAISASAGSSTTAFASGAFGSLDITTTGFLGLGGAGATRATAGNIRNPHGFQWKARNNANTADRTIIDWGVTANDNLHIGDQNVVLVLNGTSSGQGAIIRLGGTNRLALSSTTMNVETPNLLFGVNQTGPVFAQETRVTNGATGETLFAHAQNCTGTTSVGGAFRISPGTGTSAGGELSLERADGTKRIRINDTGLGFFGSAPVAKPTVTVTHSGELSSLLTALSDLGLVTNGATTTSPVQVKYSGNVETSSTTTTTILSIDTSGYGSQVSAVVEIYVTCIDVIGQGASKNTASFSRQGGTLTNLSALTANGGSGLGTVSVDASGANYRVRITAPDAVNYRWEAFAVVTYSNIAA